MKYSQGRHHVAVVADAVGRPMAVFCGPAPAWRNRFLLRAWDESPLGRAWRNWHELDVELCDDIAPSRALVSQGCADVIARRVIWSLRGGRYGRNPAGLLSPEGRRGGRRPKPVIRISPDRSEVIARYPTLQDAIVAANVTRPAVGRWLFGGFSDREGCWWTWGSRGL